jgi:hypothetical protein
MKQIRDVTPEVVAAELAAREALAPRIHEWVERFGGETVLAFVGHDVHTTPTRGRPRPRWSRPLSKELGPGGVLCETLPVDLQRRIWTLMGLEAPLLDSLDDEHDFWGAVWMGSQLAEGVLAALLREPALEVAGLLIEALDGLSPMRQVLEGWLAGQPLTLATLQVILRAFRKAEELHQTRPGEVLAWHFGPNHAGLLGSGGPESCLEQIRGLKALAEAQSRPLTRVDYLELTKRLVGARSMSLWNRKGPQPTPPRADAAILHHHLYPRWRLMAPEASTV